MIVEFFIKLIAGIVTGVFSIVPQWGISTDTITTIGNTTTGFASLNNWFPEQLVFICFGIAIAVRLFFFAWSGVLFLYRLVPFNG